MSKAIKDFYLIEFQGYIDGMKNQTRQSAIKTYYDFINGYIVAGLYTQTITNEEGKGLNKILEQTATEKGV